MSKLDTLLGDNKDRPSCKPPTPKLAGGLRKLVQEFNPVPIRQARVRFDRNVGKWAILDHDNKSQQHFDQGVMENVTFDTTEVTKYVGCGGRETDRIGIAIGSLRLHKTCDETIGAHNLQFVDGAFADEKRRPLTYASKLVMMPERRAIYFT